MTGPRTDFLTTLPDRAVLAIAGGEARTFLQRVITQGPEGADPQTALFSALLTPQGKVLADFIVFDDGDGGLLLDLPAQEAEALLKRFSLYRLRADATLTLRPDLAVAAARGESEAELRLIAQACATDPRNAVLGLRGITAAGGPVDAHAYHAARIAAGIPEFGSDYGSAEVFSTDVNHDWMGGINYKKGCFVGQEVASRMHRKAGVRKRTLRLVTPDTRVQPGAPVLADALAVGTVSSSTDGMALALLRIDRLDATSPLSINGSPVTLTDPGDLERR